MENSSRDGNRRSPNLPPKKSGAPILWPSDGKTQLTGKDPDVGKDRRQEEKGTTEDGMVGWHH